MGKPFIVPVFLPHSGCPNRCVFCNQSAIADDREAFPGPEQMEADIRRYLNFKADGRGASEISFYGGNFLNLPLRRVRMCLDTAAAFVSRKEVDGIRFSTRPDSITPQSLEWIADYPVTTIELGAQSMADHVLRLSRRGHSPADTRRAARLLKTTPYQWGVQIMIGLPGDTPFLSASTAREIADLRPDLVRIYPTLVIKGTLLAAWYQQGRYRPLSLEECMSRLKAVYRIFHNRSIPVARMGLQATEGLSGGDVIAGPYHPALGHRVLSELMRDTAEKKIRGISPLYGEITLRVHPRSYSRMQGLNRENLAHLKRRFHLSRIQLETDPGLPDLAVEVSNSPVRGTGPAA
jgi:histone acetyltransferase (RNA polymerase elongator complex component)